MSENLLIIFTRNPELGKVKTRLAKSIGDDNALTIYKTLLSRTEKTTKNLNCDKAVYYSVKIREHDIWDSSIYQKYQQQGDDLGIRMHNAFSEAFNNNFNKVAIIGSDLFDLNPNHINDAFRALDSKDVVIGPAQDGGYYLLGMKTLHSQVFKNKKWGTASVLKDTLKDLQKNHVYLLKELNDIDTFEDMKNNSELIKLIHTND